MAARQYRSTVEAKTLSAGINSSVTSMTLNSVTTLPSSYPYTLVIDPDLSTEEIVSVTASGGGNALTIVRGQDGTSAQSHNASAVVKHMITARDLQEPQDHIAASSAVHGVTGAVVGTSDTQVLTSKTLNLTSNTLTGTTAQFNTALSDGDFATQAGTEVLTNKTINLTSNTLSGTKAQFNTALSDADFATLTGTETLTGKTVDLTSNTLTGTTAQFNTALSDNDFATLAGAETLTNKKLTTPYFYQASPFTSSTATLTLTAANIDARILRYIGTNTANHTWTMPTATDLNNQFTAAATGDSFDFYVINNNPSGTAGTLTIASSTGLSLYGTGIVFAADTGGHFRLHKTGTAAWNLYRLA